MCSNLIWNNELCVTVLLRNITPMHHSQLTFWGWSKNVLLYLIGDDVKWQMLRHTFRFWSMSFLIWKHQGGKGKVDWQYIFLRFEVLTTFSSSRSRMWMMTVIKCLNTIEGLCTPLENNFAYVVTQVFLFCLHFWQFMEWVVSENQQVSIHYLANFLEPILCWLIPFWVAEKLQSVTYYKREEQVL